MHENYESNDMPTSSLSVKASGVILLDRLVAVTVSQSEMILLTQNLKMIGGGFTGLINQNL
jgi:hypothetical protein